MGWKNKAEKAEKPDIDTNHEPSGWVCRAYRGTKLLAESAYYKTKTEAQTTIIALLAAVKIDATTKAVTWNPEEDRTSWALPKTAGQLTTPVSQPPFSTLPSTLGASVSPYPSFPAQQAYPGSGSYDFKHCDHDPTDVLNTVYTLGTRGIPIIGATRSCITGEKKDEKRLIVNFSGIELAGSVRNPFGKIPSGLSWIDSVAYTAKMPPDFGAEMMVTWPDHSAPDLHPSFWTDLRDHIVDLAFPYNSVVFCCIGGHGRTGTALASLAIAAGVYDDRAVTFEGEPDRKATRAEQAECYIQAVYCESAIETADQVRYLEWVEQTIRE